MFQQEREEFKFDWSHLGDIKLGRPNLGPTTNVAVYRLMQYTLRDAAIKHTNVETADRIFYDAGYNAGKALYENMIGEPQGFENLVNQLQQILQDLNIGILRFENSDLNNMTFTLTVDEDLDCSGLPQLDEAVCTYDEGFISGLLSEYTGKNFSTKEVDCWCSGDRVCRFEASLAA